MVDPIQAKGSTSILTFDTEASNKTLRSEGSRYARKLPFNTFDVRRSTPLAKSNTLRGNRNPVKPFRQNKDVGGQLVIPIDKISIGYWLSMIFGFPTTTESSPSDIKTGTPTITITSGVATLSAAQSDWQVGDRIEYTVGGDTVYAWIKTINSTTEAVVVDQYGFDNLEDVTTGSSVDVDSIKRIIYTHTYKISPCATLPTFMLEFYDCSQKVPTYQKFLGDKINTFSIVSNAQGDELTASMDVLGAGYTKSSDKANSTPGTVDISSGSATFSESHSDVAVGDMVIYGDNYDQAFITNKSSDTAMTLKTTRGGSTNPDDVTGDTVHAILRDADYIGGGAEELVEFTFDRYEMEDATVQEGGSNSDLLKTLTLNYSNELDGSNYTLSSNNERRSIPEGVSSVDGSFEAVFENDDILEKAEEREESSIELDFTHPDNESSFTLTMNEILYQPRSPGIPGPQGLVLDLTFMGYYDDHSGESAFTIALINTHPSYAL